MEAGTRVRKWNRQLKDAFIDGLVANGSVKATFAALQVSSASAYRHRRDDPVFARQWAWAQQVNNEALWDEELCEQRKENSAERSERLRVLQLGVVGRMMVADHARRAVEPEGDIERAALLRARMSTEALARSLGFEL